MQKKMKMNRFLIAGALLLFCNCSLVMKQSFLSEPMHTNASQLELNVKRFSIKDERRSTDERVLNIPFLTWPGNKDEISPALTSEHKEVIKTEIGKFIKGKGVEVEISATLVEGVKRFEADYFYEKEYVKTVVRLEVIDGYHQPYLYSATGESFLEVKSIDASNKYIEELYKKCLQMSIRKGIESLNGGVKSIKNTHSKQLEDAI